MPSQDWRVQVATVLVDGMIVLGVFLLLGLKVIDGTVTLALLGPLVGARAAVHKQQRPAALGAAPTSSPTENSEPPNAGGAVAIAFVLAGGALLAWTWLRGHGVVAVALVLALAAAGTAYALDHDHARRVGAAPAAAVAAAR